MKSSVNPSGVEITAQGTLLTVTPFRQLSLFEKSGNTRGVVDRFSHKSRKRLLEMLCRLKSPGKNGYRSNTSFVTLTTKKIYHPADFKPLLFTWLKRLKRKSGRMSGIWRIEYQKRGATHAHIILYNAPYVNKEWIQESWGEVISQTRPFTRIERVKNHKQIMSYASKYIAKYDGGFINLPYLTADRETGEIRPVGRQWGVYNRGALPYANSTTITTPLNGSFWLMRRYCQKLWGGLDMGDSNGFTIFCDDPETHLRHLEKLSQSFIAQSNWD